MRLAPGGCPDDPVAPYPTEFGTPDELLVFFWIFLFREAAAAELVAVARAVIAKTENFMVVVVGYVVALLIIRSARVTILCLLCIVLTFFYTYT